MIVELSARYVSPFGTGMSSNSLRTALVDVAQAPRSRRATSGRSSLCSLMAPSLTGAPRHGKRIWPALRQPNEPREVGLDGARDLTELLPARAGRRAPPGRSPRPRGRARSALDREAAVHRDGGSRDEVGRPRGEKDRDAGEVVDHAPAA